MRDPGRILRACFALAGAFISTLTAAQDNGGGNLIIRTNKLSPELVTAVTKVGEERLVSAPAKSDIFKIISDSCGAANARRYYLALFLAANADNAELRAGKTVISQPATLRVPACLFAEDKPAAILTADNGPQWGTPIEITEYLPELLPPTGRPGVPIRWTSKSPPSMLVECTPKVRHGK